MKGRDRPLTRRNFLFLRMPTAGIVVGGLLRAQTELGSNGRTRRGESSMDLERNFPGGASLSVSPDGSLGCLYWGRVAESFSWTGRNWTHPGSKGEELQILNMKTWDLLQGIPLSRKLARADFFGDSGSLYVQTVGQQDRGRFTRVQMVVNVRTGAREERVADDRSAESGHIGYQPLRAGRLLGVGLDKDTRLLASIFVAELPNYSEIARVAIKCSDLVHPGTGVVVSNDRTRLGYICDQKLSWRNAEDLSLQWERPIAVGMMPRFLKISSNGRYAAVVLVNTFAVEQQNVYYIEVLSASDGSLVARLPVNGFQGADISPQGRYIAVSRYDWLGPKSAKAAPQVFLYELASGRLAGTVSHDVVRDSRERFSGMLVPSFSPDGRYLITSGLDATKVWRMLPEG